MRESNLFKKFTLSYLVFLVEILTHKKKMTLKRNAKKNVNEEEMLHGGFYEICNPVFRRYAMVILSAALLYVYYRKNNSVENVNLLEQFVRSKLGVLERELRASGPLFQGIWNSAILFWKSKTTPDGMNSLNLLETAFHGINTIFAIENIITVSAAGSWIVYVICALLTGAYNVVDFARTHPRLILILATTAAAAAARNGVPQLQNGIPLLENQNLDL